jgi:hypothetical protein
MSGVGFQFNGKRSNRNAICGIAGRDKCRDSR